MIERDLTPTSARQPAAEDGVADLDPLRNPSGRGQPVGQALLALNDVLAQRLDGEGGTARATVW
ncbi:MAG: hypothetical protein WDN69_17140 [Aliidongia sp.]